MHLILTGATGLVGASVLDAMLIMPDVTRISILTRRPVPMLEARGNLSPKVNVILHHDFERYDDALLQQLKGAAGVVWALGISQTQVDKDTYVEITKTYPLAAAQAFQTLGTATSPLRFVYVSGEGATTTPDRGRFVSLFARVKGETELALAHITNNNLSSPTLAAVSVRPGGVDPHGHTAILPYVNQNLSLPLKLMQLALLPPLRLVYPSMLSPTPALGRFLAEVAMGRYDGRFEGQGIEKIQNFPIVNNVAFRRLACV